MIVFAAQRAHLRVQIAQALGQFCDLVQQIGMDAIGIQQGELAGLVEQGLMFVLAVNFEQALAEQLQLCQRGRAAVDPGARGAFAADHPAQLAGVAVVEFLGSQPRTRRGRIRERKTGDQFRALAAVPHHAGIGAIAGEQQQGIDQQRLARASFAGDDGESGTERDFGCADDGEILDEKCFEHARHASMREDSAQS